MQCVDSFLGICFVAANSTASLFGFKDFIAALALLIIIYTVSDIRYRFRVSVSPIPLFKISYALIGLIGFGTLATDIWISEKWLVPDSLITTAIWQGTLAALFLGLVITWMHYAFIKPPIFGRNNYQRYAQELYRIVLKGSEAELPIIAHELAASAKSLVTLAAGLVKVKAEAKEKLKPCAEGYAGDMLLLIANRRFCRHLVASSPLTAIRFLDAVAESKAYRVPIGLFAQNVSTEAIRNKDSGLYHEDEGYYSGLLGYIKPFSRALYGNYELVEALQNHSPLDIHYKSVWAWDADQFETYCRVAQMTLKSYLEGGHWEQHSYVLTRALHDIQETTSRAILDLKKAGDDYYGDAWHRLSAGVDFIKDSINAIGELKPPPEARTLRIRDQVRSRLRDEDFYDRLAQAMFEIIFSAAYIDGPPDKAWSIHYSSVWGDFFERSNDNRAWKIVQFKLRRLLYDEIRDLESMPNYKAARVLGICLNVMGLTMGKRSGYGRDHAALKAAVLAWTQRNYLRLRKVNAEVADTCLIGSITFDAEQSRLVKTYAKGLRPDPDREYLPLQSPPVAV
ncbi:MAG: hypothetical protein A2637_07015 [Candidatus Muproteobacteria bacterium RIFCSPHIGHO2_01_FULL_65_16]|uniref:Uncharacterized protein n=1 Tax=Candidatus Muproteobacteria bacterium RIFCSPHIGHO2_01_FULL_65_16 TaxID=1817764 RepID=A0A1F6TP10_9PROT|nr:MAG: hypothetical protein A2637_07015 [Candidatus Muproteobacteria bacterium RIFCSPHIGHO2_01_FULL_65_16]